VGVYVNGAYTGKTGEALLNFIDLKRMERLEGPQGTLFGRTSVGVQVGCTSARRCNADILLNFGCVQMGSYRIGYPNSRVDAQLGCEPASQKCGVGSVFDNRRTSATWVALDLGGPARRALRQRHTFARGDGAVQRQAVSPQRRCIKAARARPRRNASLPPRRTR
jgi:iron complex outermembrane recepter protein